MSLIKKAVNNSMDIWKGYMEHPFIKELSTGELSEESFKNYIVQDSLYLMDFARVYALGMYKSRTLKEIQNFYSILSFVNADETATRIKYLNKWGITQEEIEATEMKKENKGYTEFMLSIGLKEEIPEILMATLPCMFSYNFIAEEIMKGNPEIQSTKYWDFIKDYSSESYKECCMKWEAYADELCAGIEESRKERLVEIFKEASIHEMNFWDMSYLKGDKEQQVK